MPVAFNSSLIWLSFSPISVSQQLVFFSGFYKWIRTHRALFFWRIVPLSAWQQGMQDFLLNKPAFMWNRRNQLMTAFITLSELKIGLRDSLYGSGMLCWHAGKMQLGDMPPCKLQPCEDNFLCMQKAGEVKQYNLMYSRLWAVWLMGWSCWPHTIEAMLLLVSSLGPSRPP